jgi:lauroyl/myristoyl acyltransferase
MILRPLLNPAKYLLSSVTRFVRHGLKKSRTFVTPTDVYEVVRLSGQSLLAWTLPEAAWWPVSRVLGRFNVATNPRRTRKEVAQITALLSGTWFESDAYSVAVKNWACRYQERFQYLRTWRPRGWSPRIDVVGREHVTAALGRGNGIIFWGGLFSFNNLLAKMAMHRLGLAVLGFSVPAHGFSATKFGVRYLNRVFRDIEDLYLEERLMPWPQDFPAALQRMRERLKTNGVVYFAVGGRGRRIASAKFLGGHIFIATGPIAMAHATGAALLPLHTLRIAPAWFEVTIGPPIDMRMTSDGNVDYAATVQAYADALTPFVLRDPGQWSGWHLIQSRGPWGGKRRLQNDCAASPDRSPSTRHDLHAAAR